MKEFIGNSLITKVKLKCRHYDIWDTKLTGFILRVHPSCQTAPLLDHPTAAYLGQLKICWLTTESVFDLLTHHKNQGAAAYQQFMLEQSHDSAKNFSLSMQKSFPAICDDAFMQQLTQLQCMGHRMVKITIKELVELICEYYAVKDLDLHMRSQKRLPSKIRLMTARLAIQFKVANLTNIATYFNRDVSTFSRGLSRTTTTDNIEFNSIRC